MYATSVTSSTSSTVGTIPALDSSFSNAPSQYNGVLASGGVGPATSVHVLWDLGTTSGVGTVTAWASGTAEAWSSVDGTTWTDLGPASSTGLSVAGSARYIQFTLSGTGSQIYETALKDGGGSPIGPPIPIPLSPGAPTIGVITTSSIAIGLPAFTTNTTSLTLLRAVDSGSGFGSFSILVSGVTTPNSIYTDTTTTYGNNYIYAAKAVGIGGTSSQGPSSSSAAVTNFTITPSSSTLIVNENRSVTVQFVINAVNGFVGSVQLTGVGAAGFTTAFSPASVSGSGIITATVFATATPGSRTLSYSAIGNDGGAVVTHAISLPITVLAPLTPDSASAVVFSRITQTSALAFIGDLPPGASSMSLQTQISGAGWVTVATVNANSQLPLSSLTPNTIYSIQILAAGPGGSSTGSISILSTLPTPLPSGVPWLPNGPLVRLGPRVPDGGVGLAYIDIPPPDPSSAAIIIDLSRSSRETAGSRGIDLGVSGVLARVSTGTRPDPGSAEQISTSKNQAAATLPIRISKVEQNPAGGWEPIATRGLFYRALTMADDQRSWLWKAGFRPGQRLLAAYTTETDWAGIANPSASSGILQRIRKQVTPAGPLVSLQTKAIGMLGGLKSLSGVELLATSTAAGTAANLTWEVFPATEDPKLGRVRSSIASSTGQIPLANLAVGALFSSIISSDVSKSVVRFSGSLHAPAEALYLITCNAPGLTRMSFWGCPVLDRWYSPSQSQSSSVQVYLHAGWHDFSIEIAPQSQGSFTLATMAAIGITEFSAGFFPTGFLPSGYTGVSGTIRNMECATGKPIGSHVTSIDLVRGMLSLSGSWGTDLQASFTEESDCPIRGYFDDLGKWRGLDLNPCSDRVYDNGKSTSDWLLYPCVIFIIPSLVCALTDVFGNTIAPQWVSSSTFTRSCLRWGQSNSAISSVLDSSSFGESSLFADAVLGSSLYSSSGGASGVVSGNDADIFEGYRSATPIALIDINSGLPFPSSDLLHDVRKLGGGLSPQNKPWTFRGAAKERVNTHWDISPWDGNDSIAGKVLVRIPSAYLTGSDGMVAWTQSEIENVVNQTLAAGIEAVIQIV